MADHNEETAEKPEKTNGETEKSGPLIPSILPPPDTKSPIAFNQQVNVYPIPQTAWDRLSNEQTMELTKLILEKADASDKRQFDYAMNHAGIDDRSNRLCVKVGAAIAIAGFAGSALLAIYGHDLAAISISLPLTTVLAVVVGNRFLQ